MKKVLNLFACFVCSISVISCNSSEDPIIESYNDSLIEMGNYNDAVYANRELISNWCFDALETPISRAGNLESYDNLKEKLLPTATMFASELNLTDADLEEIFGKEVFSSEENKEDALVGILLFSTMTDCSHVGDRLSRGGSFKDCFIEATGIGAGVVLVGGLVKGAMSKAMIKAIAKLALKTCGRAVCGIGLALIAAEIAWCMW